MYLTPGYSRTKTFRAWWNMKQRCDNPNRHDYYRYGGRGIAVCAKWLHSFKNFLQDMGECPEGLTLDRTNNNLGYFPENCRWATWDEQRSSKAWHGRRGPLQEKLDRAFSLYLKGATLQQAAKAVGISKTSLWREVRRIVRV